jgi:hypothetical protein
MGLGGIIKSAFHKAENVFHKAENDVKKTVQTVEKTTAKQVSAFVGNVVGKLGNDASIAKFVPTQPNAPARLPKGAIGLASSQSKGFLGDLWDGIKSVGNAIGSAVSSVGNAIGSAFSSVGNAIKKGFEWGKTAVGNALEWGRNALKEVGNRALDIGKSVLNFVTEGVGGLVRSAFEGAGKILSGVGSLLNPAPLLKLFTGDFKGAWEDFKGNIGDGLSKIGNGLVQGLIQGPFDTAVIGLQNIVSIAQTAIGVEPVGRSLNETETAELRKVYGNSIDLSQIRIKEGDLGLNNLLAPHTIGNTIYLPKNSMLDPSNPRYSQDRLETLVHEVAHTWQYQNGGTDYIGASVWNQLKGAVSGGSRNAAYEYDEPIKSGKSWTELNPEQQAHLIENAYVQGLFDNPNATFRLKDGTDATAYVRDAINQMRNGRGAA